LKLANASRFAVLPVHRLDHYQFESSIYIWVLATTPA